jgi:hypothetical protein
MKFPLLNTQALAGALLACYALLAPGQALAWGAEGHRAVAIIAALHLKPHAFKAVQDLMGPSVPDEMANASVWADEIRRERRETARLHFVNIPIQSQGFDAARDCPERACVVAAVEDYARKAADQTQPLEQRREALAFLIHFVGDLHQPLHCADDHDHGGNEVPIQDGNHNETLHAWWDTDVVKMLGKREQEIADKVDPLIDRRWAGGTPADWANESWVVARNVVYAHLPGPPGHGVRLELTQQYEAEGQKVAAVQLAKAGIRLAAIMNAIFP